MEDIAERISFTVSARATEANKNTHNRFKESAWERADGDYTEELRYLYRVEDEFSRYLEQDRQVERVRQELDEVKGELHTLEQIVEQELSEPKEQDTDSEDNDAF